MFFFFFSSRRRHTRFSRDWSSDVCSSDLIVRSRVAESLKERPRMTPSATRRRALTIGRRRRIDIAAASTKPKITSAPSISMTGNHETTPRGSGGGKGTRSGGLVDLPLQEEVQDGSQDDDRRKLADLVPGRRDRRPQHVRRELELESEGKPLSQVQADGFLRIGTSPAQKDADGPDRRLEDRQPDQDRGTGLASLGEVGRPLLEKVVHLVRWTLHGAR